MRTQNLNQQPSPSPYMRQSCSFIYVGLPAMEAGAWEPIPQAAQPEYRSGCLLLWQLDTPCFAEAYVKDGPFLSDYEEGWMGTRLMGRTGTEWEEIRGEAVVRMQNK